MQAELLQTFEILVDDDRYAVPTLHLVSASDESEALAVAQRLLAESDHHKGVEVCREGERLAGLGTLALRSPAGGSRNG